MESITNANSPIAIIISVSQVTKASACIRKEIVIPSSSVIRFASVVCAVSDIVFNTPHSRIRFPNIKNPTSATEVGATSPTIIVTIIGNAMRMVLLTF